MKNLLLLLLLIAGYCPIQAQNSSRLRDLAGEATRFSTAGQVVLLDSTSVSVTSSGSGSFAVYKAILVNDLEGILANRIIRYDYDPLTASATFKYARIHRQDGRTIEVDVNRTQDYTAPARMIYWGARQIMLETGRLEKGDILEYEISKKGFTYALLAAQEDEERFVPPMRGEFYDIVPFWCGQPTLKKVYQVSIPREKDIQYQFYQGECSSSMRYAGKRKIYRFTANRIHPFAKEPNMVDLYDAAPKLMLSSTPEWKDKSLWFHKTNEDYDSFHAFAPAKKKVDELIRGKHDEMGKIAALTHWVADNIRYSGISMGKGEGFTLHSTRMNYTDRCGVCKDIAGTLISFLRMAGFEAYPAMTMAGSRVESIPADHFNHCVAVVKLSNGTYMPLDPTWVPFCRELWSSAEQQQNYLPGTPEGSDLCQTPVSAPENHYFRIAARNRLDRQGNLTGKLTLKAEGQSDLAIRRIFTTGWQSEWRNHMESQLLAISPQARLLSVDWGRNPKDYQAGPIEITFRYEIPDYAVTGKEEMLFKPLSMSGFYSRIRSYLRINTDMAERKYGFKDACSRLVELDETIEIPEGYRMQQGQAADFKGKAADFKGSISQEKGRIEIHQQLKLKKRVYEASDWESFRTAVNLHKQFGAYITINR